MSALIPARRAAGQQVAVPSGRVRESSVPIIDLATDLTIDRAVDLAVDLAILNPAVK